MVPNWTKPSVSAAVIHERVKELSVILVTVRSWGANSGLARGKKSTRRSIK